MNIFLETSFNNQRKRLTFNIDILQRSPNKYKSIIDEIQMFEGRERQWIKFKKKVTKKFVNNIRSKNQP